MENQETQTPVPAPDAAPPVPALPEKVEPVDMLMLENANLRREVMELRLQIAQKDVEMMATSIRDRYAIRPEDQIDAKTLAIVRKG